MTPYESRVVFGGRTGGVNTNYDVDQIHVQWSDSLAPTDPFHWLGATGDYNTASLWTNGILPTANDNAVIGVGVATSGGLAINGTGSVTVEDTGWLNVSGNLYIGEPSGSDGQFFQDGGKVTVSGALRLGVNGGATGAYTMTDGELVVTNYLIPGASGTGTFTQSGGTVTQTGGGRLLLGDHAGSWHCNYDLSGGTLSVLGTTLADKAGTTATFTLSGTGIFNSAGDVEVGDGGVGVLNVLGGTANFGYRLIVGVQAGSDGTVNHSGGTVNTSSDLYVVNASTAVGVYNISGDAQLKRGRYAHRRGPRWCRSLPPERRHGESPAAVRCRVRRLGRIDLHDQRRHAHAQRCDTGRPYRGGHLHPNRRDGDRSGRQSFRRRQHSRRPRKRRGVYNLQGGTLNVNILAEGANGQFNFTGGRLNANTVQFDLTNDGGILAPGNSPGLTEITGNYIQTVAGTYEIELGGYNGGVDHDLVHVTGTATLDGALDVLLIDPFVPLLGDTFDVLVADGGIIDQGLDVTSLNAQVGGYSYEIIAGTGSTEILRLTAIPEPSTCTLLGLGVLGLLGFVGRRKLRNR